MYDGQWGRRLPKRLADRRACFDDQPALLDDAFDELDEGSEMLEWLQHNDGFSTPADAATEVPRASLRLNHIEKATQAYLNDPALGLSPADFGEAAQKADQQRIEAKQDRARERVELRFGSFTYTVRSSGTVRIVGYDGTSHLVEIPERIRGNEVTALDSSLFFEHGEIEAVVMPDTIESIGHRLFEKCAGLKSVRLSGGLTQAGSGIFARCEHIEKIQINAPSVSLEGKFLSGVSVGHIDFGPAVKGIDVSEFGVKNLESISVDEANTAIMTDGKALFSADGATLLRLIVPVEHYEVPATCTVIGDKAFDSMRSLRSVGLPQGLKSIGRLAFAKTSLRSIEFPSSMEEIGEKAFFFCAGLTEINLPQALHTLNGEAFSSTGVKAFTIPQSLRFLGARPFDKTPAQENVSQGSIVVYGGNARAALPRTEDAGLYIDSCGGVYMGDRFLELIGLVSEYTVAPGTRVIADGACKRHATLRSIVLPDGVEEIGAEAFRGNKGLTSVDLPASLKSIGARAFLDTSLRYLHLGAQVTFIGENALIVQGENSLIARDPLRGLDLDPANERFYIENGLLIERGAAADGAGDAVVLYLGTESVVRIPDAVTQIDSLAFCGSFNMDELHLHDHIQSICQGALSTRRTVNMLHLQFREPVRGVTEAHLIMPGYTTRYRSMMPLFESRDPKTRFNFEYYDTWVACSTETSEFAPAALERLKNPVRLCKRCRELYEGTFTRKALSVCRYFASKGDLEALVQLYEWGYIEDKHIQQELDASLGGGDAQKTAALLELRNRMTAEPAGIDFSL